MWLIVESRLEFAAYQKVAMKFKAGIFFANPCAYEREVG